ncbi:MAG: hypothetical protein VW547_01505 [Alphaproteobacteria bacterium]
MSVAEYTFPDPVPLLRERLLEVTSLTALVSTRILSRTGDPLPSRPFVRLDLIGGSFEDPRYMRSHRFQIHVFHDHESAPAAVTAAQAAIAGLTATRAWEGATGLIVGTTLESDISIFYDTTHVPPLVDVTFSVQVSVRR